MTECHLLMERIGEIDGNIRSIIAVYMTWYTFYWILNGTVLAWKQKEHDAGPLPKPVVVFFIVMAVPSAISSWVVIFAIDSMIGLVDDISVQIAAITKMGQASSEAFLQPIWPRLALWWGLSINGIATGCLLIIWSLQLRHRLHAYVETASHPEHEAETDGLSGIAD